MNIEQEQFDKAQQFVIEQLENTEKTKDGLTQVVQNIEEEWKSADNVDYQRALMVFVHQMNEEVKEFNEKN